MASGTTVFQTAVTATPPNGLPIMADSVNDNDHGQGTAQYIKIMDGRTAGTIKAAVTANGLEVDVTRIQGTVQTLGSIQGVGTFHVLGSVQGVGTFQILGTLQPLAGSVHVANAITGTVQVHGTAQALGTFQPLAGSVHLASRLPGTADIGTVAGTVSVLGTVQPLAGSVHIASTGTLPLGTLQALGTFQPLAGSVHIASTGTLPLGSVQVLGSVQTVGTSQVLGSVQGVGTFQVLGSVQTVGTRTVVGTVQVHGTAQALGTFQPLAGSVHIANSLTVTIGTISGGTIQAFGTTEVLGTVRALTAVDVTVGTITEGTIQSFTGTAQVLGSIQAVGTTQALGTFQPLAGSVHVANAISGTVQTHGTSQVLGTMQPLAGSVHVANVAAVLGSVSAQGYVANGGVAAGNPILFGGFGSSGTQAAVDDGDVVRLWADLNGRLQVRGTIDSLPTITGTVQTHGTSQALGTFQPLAGSVHLASRLPGTADIGTIAGTISVGTVARVAGTVLTKPNQAGEGFFGSIFTAAVTNGTLVPAPGAGTFVRVWGMMVSGSAAGSAFVEFGNGTNYGQVFLAANGGFVYTSAKGIRTNGTNQDILFNCAAGSWGVSVEYTLEIA